MVVPGGQQLGRRDVVVVDDQRLAPCRQPGGHRRRRGELVEQRRRPPPPAPGYVEHRRCQRARVRPRRCRHRSGSRIPRATMASRRREGVPTRRRRHRAGRGRTGGCRSRGRGGREGEARRLRRRRRATVEGGDRDEARPLQEQTPTSRRAAAAAPGGPGRPLPPACRRRSGSLATIDDRRAQRQGVPGARPAATTSAWSGRRSTTPLSTRPPVRPAAAGRHRSATSVSDDRVAPLQRAQGDRSPGLDAERRRRRPSRGRRGALPRHNRRAPPRRPASPRRCAATTGSTHWPSSCAGTSQAAPSMGRSSKANRSSSVRTRAERKRKASTTWAMACSNLRVAAPPAGPAPVPGPARRCDPAAWRRRRFHVAGPPRRPGIRRRHLSREVRGTGLVRAVAITQVGEGGQEVPGIAPLGRQAGERGVERLDRCGMTLLGSCAHGAVASCGGDGPGGGGWVGHGDSMLPGTSPSGVGSARPTTGAPVTSQQPRRTPPARHDRGRGSRRSAR